MGIGVVKSDEGVVDGWVGEVGKSIVILSWVNRLYETGMILLSVPNIEQISKCQVIMVYMSVMWK